ncbi:MAG: glycosyltransferase family 2 protein [Thermoleophilia bacterium]|nr:glycosyltransferase family 2 protein [Thermoleophilia bacterium]
MDDSEAALLVVVPAHNEATRVGPVVKALVAGHGLPVLVVDDGSSDNTAAEAKEAGATVLSLQPNRGKGAALKAGFREALGSEIQWAAIMTLDADGQHDPADVPNLVEAWRQTGADLVIGFRDYRSMPPVRRFTNTVSRLLLRSALGQWIPDNQSGFRLRSRRLAEAVLASPETGFAFEVEEIAICLGRGYNLAWVPVRTIYGEEKSDIRPWSHFVGFLRVALRARRRMKAEVLRG